MANEKGSSVYTKKLTCSASNQEEDMLTSRNEVHIVADGDCFINFDAAVTTTERFLIKANVQYVFSDIMVRQLNYLAAASTPAIYVMAYKSGR